MPNYVISNEQRKRYGDLKNRLRYLMAVKKIGFLDIVTNRIYLRGVGGWTIISEKNEVREGIFSLQTLLTEYACHLMGGMNLGLMFIKDQKTFDELFNGFIELMKIDEEYLQGDTHE